MSIARYLAERSGGILAPEPEISEGGGDYQMFNAGGVECEVGEFLYGLVRMVKPERILETGTHWGVSASFMGQALKENGHGKLTTIENQPYNVAKARALIEALGLTQQVEIVPGDARAWEPGATRYDLILLDTELQFRFADWVRLWPSLKEGGFLIVHDLHGHMNQTGIIAHGVLNGAYGVLPSKIEGLIRSHQVQSLHFETPRGLYVGQKSAPDFHSTKLLTGHV